MILQIGWANLPRAERLAKRRAYMRVWRADPKHREYDRVYRERNRGYTRDYRMANRHRMNLQCRLHNRINTAFKRCGLPTMTERDITAEGLLGCTYDEYDRYRYLCKWPIWRV